MLQRIQTVFFALAVVALASLFIVDLYHVSTKIPATVTYIKITNHPSHSLLLSVLSGLCVGLGIGVIFRYTNRKLQIKLGGIWVLLQTALLALIVFDYSADKSLGLTIPWVGMFMPMVSLILTLLGIRGVRKDEALVRSADRIR